MKTAVITYTVGNVGVVHLCKIVHTTGVTVTQDRAFWCLPDRFTLLYALQDELQREGYRPCLEPHTANQYSEADAGTVWLFYISTQER